MNTQCIQNEYKIVILNHSINDALLIPNNIALVTGLRRNNGITKDIVYIWILYIVSTNTRFKYKTINVNILNELFGLHIDT